MRRNPKFLGLRAGAVIIIALAGVASIALTACDQNPPAAPKQDAASAPDQLKDHLDKLKWRETPQPAPDTAFTDADGKEHTLAEFKGKVLVVNFWATWCAPCVKEMPTLDTLEKSLGGDKFAVLAISQDREGAKVAKPYADNHGWKNVELFYEPAGHFARDTKLNGLPTSLLVDRNGQEVARLEGENAWDAPDVQKVITDLIAKP